MNRLKNYEQAKGVFRALNYTFFDKGFYNLNLFAVRNAKQVPNLFNDVLYIAYRDERNTERLEATLCTTVPGVPFLLRPINPAGAAAIAEGQYRGLWKPGYFRGRWALLQVGKVRAYRDNNFDGKFDFDASTITTYGAEAGFFLHETYRGAMPAYVENSSAGCIVPQQAVFMETLRRLVRSQFRYLGTDLVTFTLFNSRQLDYIVG
jgi:hypothetical protein